MGADIVFNENRAELMSVACTGLFDAIRARNSGDIVFAVPGGRSVVPLLEEIVQRSGELEQEAWKRVHFFMVDERLVPLEHDDSNYKLVRGLLSGLVEQGLVDENQFHPFVFSLESADLGIAKYEAELMQCGGAYHIGILGVGEDAHVGALFPKHHSIANQSKCFFTMEDSPKPPPERMTSSLSLLSGMDFAVALFLGEGKKDALRLFSKDGTMVDECPAVFVNQLPKALVISDQKP